MSANAAAGDTRVQFICSPPDRLNSKESATWSIRQQAAASARPLR